MVSVSEQPCTTAVLHVAKSFVGPHCSRNYAMYQVRTEKNTFLFKIGALSTGLDFIPNVCNIL